MPERIQNVRVRSVLCQAAIAMIAALAGSALLAADGGKLPNIVFYIADDHNQLDSEVYGAKVLKTPNLLKLAEEGMVFDHAYVASPACGPSRAALLSGLMPARNGAEENHAAPRLETQTMVKLLKATGYEVASIGKVAHLRKPEVYGFDHYDGPPTQLAWRVKKFLAARSSDKPLCLLVGDRRPHVPWTKENIYDPAKVILPSHFIDTPETREHWARSWSDITGVDSEIAKVDALAHEHFGTDDYIFMYSADHGGQWPFGKWNLYDAGSRVPLIIRWPGKIRAGSRSDAMVSWIDLFPSLLDLAGGSYPQDIDGKSFAGVLRGATDKHRDVIYTTHSGDGIMNVYPVRAVRTKRWKYIRNLRPDCYHSNHSDTLRNDGAGAYWDSWDAAAAKDPKAAAIVQKYYVRPAVELYDTEEDPTEQNNQADNPEYAAQLTKMSAMLDTWMAQTGDTQKVFREPYLNTGPKPVEVHASKKAAGNKGT